MTERVKDGRCPEVDVLQHLVQAAIADQRAISEASKVMLTTAKQLERDATEYPNWVAAEVNRKLAAVAADFNKAVRHSIKRVAWIATGYFFVACVGMVIGVYISARFILPAPDILQRAREAEETVARLAPRGGNSVLEECPTAQGPKLCIRTDERGQSNLWQRPGQTLRLIYGY